MKMSEPTPADQERAKIRENTSIDLGSQDEDVRALGQHLEESRNRVEVLTNERDDALRQRDAVERRLTELIVARDTIRQERERIEQERIALITERDRLQQELDVFQQMPTATPATSASTPPSKRSVLMTRLHRAWQLTPWVLTALLILVGIGGYFAAKWGWLSHMASTAHEAALQEEVAILSEKLAVAEIKEKEREKQTGVKIAVIQPDKEKKGSNAPAADSVKFLQEAEKLIERANKERNSKQQKQLLAEAHDLLDKAIEADPKHADAYLHRGDVRRKLGNRGATADYKKSMEIRKSR
jgi:tetratricopeptide (TPR) repeat protein